MTLAQEPLLLRLVLTWTGLPDVDTGVRFKASATLLLEVLTASPALVERGFRDVEELQL